MNMLRACSAVGLALVVSLTLPSCTNGEQPQASPQATEGVPETDLRIEYEFQPYPGSRWYGPDGHVISKRSNIVNASTGPEHCDWQSAVMLYLAWPLGNDDADVSEARQYMRDPEEVFSQDSLVTTFDADVGLPERAEFTGYRTDFMELWLDDKDDAAAYLVFADHSERWPRARSFIACR